MIHSYGVMLNTSGEAADRRLRAGEVNDVTVASLARLQNERSKLRLTGDLRPHWHMRMTSSKCVLQQRHLLGYQSRTLNPNRNPIFNPNPNPFF